MQAEHMRHMPLLGSVAEVLWGSQSKDGLVNSNQKKQGLVSSTVVLPMWCPRGRPWETGETVAHKGSWGSRIRDSHLLETLAII